VFVQSPLKVALMCPNDFARPDSAELFSNGPRHSRTAPRQARRRRRQAQDGGYRCRRAWLPCVVDLLFPLVCACRVQTHRQGPASLRKLDYAERNGYVRGVVTAIEHDPGRGAPVAHVKFRNTYRHQKDHEVVVCPEGVYTGQFLYMGKKAQLAVGNVLPVGAMPEGTIVCQVERYPGDGGKIAKTSGEYATIIGHNEDEGVTKIRMPSGGKKNIKSVARAMVRGHGGGGGLLPLHTAVPSALRRRVCPAWHAAAAAHARDPLASPRSSPSPCVLCQVGIIAGGGRVEKPMLKAGRTHHKYAAKGNKWPKITATAMNAVDHPFGGGNHQHLGRAGTVSRYASPGRKAGLIAARRTGRVRGRAEVKAEKE
jgi:large subunit ribosomal protein L8e